MLQEYGCDSLYSGDTVTLENLPGNFKYQLMTKKLLFMIL